MPSIPAFISAGLNLLTFSSQIFFPAPAFSDIRWRFSSCSLGGTGLQMMAVQVKVLGGKPEVTIMSLIPSLGSTAVKCISVMPPCVSRCDAICTRQPTGN